MSIVAQEPAAQATFLSRFTDHAQVEPCLGGIAVDLGNGCLEVIDPATATASFGAVPDRRPARLAAIRFAGATGMQAPRVVVDGGLILLFG